jgi:gamma-glutamylcyclotransferase (GGCT)/AIG2-like uncharacterized protein YtfP
MPDAEERLIVYGSLAPGGRNNFLFKGVEGTWHRCLIQGHMGRWRGFKSFRFDPEGPEHQAWLLCSPALPGMFPDLDDFEGEEYRRIVIPAKVGEQWVRAHIYEGKYFDQG